MHAATLTSQHLSWQQGEELSVRWARSGGTKKALPMCALEARAVLNTKRHHTIFVRLCRRVWVFFLYTKKLVPSLKKRPLKNYAKLALLELQGVCWEARTCKNIIERRIDIFPILKGSFVAILMLV